MMLCTWLISPNRTFNNKDIQILEIAHDMKENAMDLWGYRDAVRLTSCLVGTSGDFPRCAS